MHVHETTVYTLGKTCDPDLEYKDWSREKLTKLP
jgi:hypothetical protein